MTDEISGYNKELYYGLDLARKGTYRKCLFVDDCTEQTIWAHSVSRAVLETIQHHGEVIKPHTITSKDDSGRSHVGLRLMPEAISQASIGTFTCHTHDSIFNCIDTTPMDFDDPKVLNLLFYRAILKDAWVLFKTQKATMYQERKGPLPNPWFVHPYTRLKALLDLMSRIRPFLDGTDCPLLMHIIRRVKTAHPILAASCARGGSILAFDERAGQEIPARDVRALTSIEPNSSWVFTVIPQANGHVVVASWLKGSVAENYFAHFNKINGRELQAAISAELIYFGENWFLHPKVWASYGNTKQNAIVTSYNNVAELVTGTYKWWDRDEKIEWHEYIKVNNRHQLNLFRYNESVFTS